MSALCEGQGPARGRSGALLIPIIPVAGGVRALFGAGGRLVPPRVFPETLVSDHCLQWCENLALIGHLSKLQQVCDIKATPRYRGVPNATALSARKEWASRARKFRSHLTWMTEVRRRVIDTESDIMADMVLSQGGTSVSSHVQYEHKTHDHGRRYASAISVQPGVLPAGTQDVDMVNAMTNLVVQAMDKLELPQWLSVRELPHWRQYADHTNRLRVEMQANLGPSAKRVILSVAHADR